MIIAQVKRRWNVLELLQFVNKSKQQTNDFWKNSSMTQQKALICKAHKEVIYYQFSKDTSTVSSCFK